MKHDCSEVSCEPKPQRFGVRMATPLFCVWPPRVLFVICVICAGSMYSNSWSEILVYVNIYIYSYHTILLLLYTSCPCFWLSIIPMVAVTIVLAWRLHLRHVRELSWWTRTGLYTCSVHHIVSLGKCWVKEHIVEAPWDPGLPLSYAFWTKTIERKRFLTGFGWLWNCSSLKWLEAKHVWVDVSIFWVAVREPCVFTLKRIGRGQNPWPFFTRR